MRPKILYHVHQDHNLPRNPNWSTTLSIYAFWNNKGGTGKTSLAFQTVVGFAEKHPDKKILVIDVCPQANLSELLLGGLLGGGSKNLLALQANSVRSTIGGYFQFRLPQPYSASGINGAQYLTTPSSFNKSIPSNISLIAGDALLELQANATSTLANAQIPGQNPWLDVIDWLRDLLADLPDSYDCTFIDCNPSFSFYTQIALSIADNLILPVMADDSSRRALQNAFSLVYGLRLPSEIYAQHSFASRLTSAERQLPKVHTIVKNRLTQYMGAASAYAAVLTSIDQQVNELMRIKKNLFAFKSPTEVVCEMRDFGTTGVVAHAKGCSFKTLVPKKHSIGSQRITVKCDYLDNCREAMKNLVGRIQ